MLEDWYPNTHTLLIRNLGDNGVSNAPYQFASNVEVVVKDLWQPNQDHFAIGFKLVADKVVYQKVGVRIEAVCDNNVWFRR